MAVESRVIQEDFSGGSTMGSARYLIPDYAVYSLTNMLPGVDGSTFARGGPELLSDAFDNRTATDGQFIWEGLVGAGVRTLLADDSSFYVLDADGKTLVDIGGDGLTQPRVAAELDGYLFIGEGWIYCGSQKAPQVVNTVTLSKGSTVVTLNGTEGVDQLLDAGMIFRITGAGAGRIYEVASVTPNQVNLTEPYEGDSGNAIGYFDGIYKIVDGDPYPESDWYATGQNRMFATRDSDQPSRVQMSKLNSPLPPLANPHVWEEYDYHEVADGGTVIGGASIGNLLLVFATNGLWVLSGAGQQIVNESTGSPQHRFVSLDRDMIIKSIVGIAAWEQMLIVPAMEGVFLVDGISTPRKISEAIESDWQEEMRTRTLGTAATYRNFYVLPVLGTSRSDAPGTFVCRLDQAATDGRRLPKFGWSFFNSVGSKMSGYVTRATGGLISLERPGPSAVCDCSHVFEVEHPFNAYDQDGSLFYPALVTRDMETGGLTENVIRKLRLAREHRSINDATPDTEARALLEFSTGATETGLPYWGSTEGEWGAGFGPPLDPTATVGDQPWRDASIETAWFPVDGRDGLPETAPPDEGRTPFDFRLGRRGVGTSLRRYYGRFRIWSDRPAAKWVIQRIEQHVRPAGSTRR